MEGKLQRRMEKVLAEVDERGTRGRRLIDDAQRLWSRVRRFIDMKLIPTEADAAALELACYALQLAQKQPGAVTGKLGRSSLKQRAEQSAELLVSLFGDEVDESLLDRTSRVLHELPQRQPLIEEARLLADSVNLEDFGLIGFSVMTIQLALQGSGVSDLLEAGEKRDQYGYWDARLKEGFHFDAVRAMARVRLDHARSAIAALAAEVREEQ